MGQGVIDGNRAWRPCLGLVVEELSGEDIGIRVDAETEGVREENSPATGQIPFTQEWENEG